MFVLAGLIGDSVMCLPAISEARRLWPEAHITVLGKTHNRELISACPFYDEFYECNADPFSLRRSKDIKALERWLVDQKFDAAIILLGDQFAHLLARAGIPVRVGVNGTLLQSCLTHTYNIGRPEEWTHRHAPSSTKSRTDEEAALVAQQLAVCQAWLPTVPDQHLDG